MEEGQIGFEVSKEGGMIVFGISWESMEDKDEEEVMERGDGIGEKLSIWKSYLEESIVMLLSLSPRGSKKLNSDLRSE